MPWKRRDRTGDSGTTATPVATRLLTGLRDRRLCRLALQTGQSLCCGGLRGIRGQAQHSCTSVNREEGAEQGELGQRQ